MAPQNTATHSNIHFYRTRMHKSGACIHSDILDQLGHTDQLGHKGHTRHLLDNIPCRDGIALKKTEAQEAKESKQGQGLSDVATILARRVAVEFSDSDDGPSDSEYDSDDWGQWT